MTKTATSGRQKGFVVSDETRKATATNNPYSQSVITPLGSFISYREAGRAHGEEASAIKHRCVRGAIQRETGKGLKSKIGNDYRDYRGYYGQEKAKCLTYGFPVQTPLGIFPSLKAAADAEGITSSAICQKMKRKCGGYYYLEIE